MKKVSIYQDASGLFRVEYDFAITEFGFNINTAKLINELDPQTVPDRLELLYELKRDRDNGNAK